MNIQEAKINFVQDFLRIEDINIIEKLISLLHQEKKRLLQKEFNPMSLNQFNDIIDNAEDDFKNNRITDTDSLLEEIKQW